MFALEMEDIKIFMRMLALGSGVDMHDIMTGRVDGETLGKTVEAGEKTMPMPMWIDDSSDMSVMSIKAKSRRKFLEIAAKAKLSPKDSPELGLIIVDYLQLITSPSKRNDSRAQEVSEISRQLKSLARELNIPVVALSQLNREVEKRVGGKPVLSDIRESGAIEQDADIVLLLNRPGLTSHDDMKKQDGEIVVAKHRNGPTGTVNIKFLPNRGEFVENKKE